MDSYQITFDAWNNVAGAYQARFMDLDIYNATYNTFCGLIKTPGAKILEFGCGPGNITRYLLYKRPDFFIDATDVAPAMIALAQQNNPAAHCRVMDCRNASTLAGGYDAIMCGFCIPYLAKKDVAKLMADCAALLNAGGIFYFSTIEGEYDRSGYVADSSGRYKTFVYYHSSASLLNELDNNGFQLQELVKVPYVKNDGTTDVHLVFIAEKK